MRPYALLVCVLAVTAVARGDDRRAIGEEVDTVVPGVREQLRAQIAEGYEHVRKIEGPARQFTAAQIENPYLKKSSSYIVVIGSISDPDVRTLLGRIDERVMDVTKVTGDERFAIVQLGDPEHDPCCTTTILFENRKGVWTLVADIWQSH